MEILIAEDDPVEQRLLEVNLLTWGYQVVTTNNGRAAWQILEKEDAPRLAILDWIMPEMDGLEICRKIRQLPPHRMVYTILVTARNEKGDLVAGLSSGADDYIVKPFDPAELKARLQVGRRILDLQQTLAERVTELEEALGRVKQLRGLLPICSYCKKIRDDQNYWQQVDAYIASHSEARFSHGVCPECYENFVKPGLENLKAKLDSKAEDGT